MLSLIAYGTDVSPSNALDCAEVQASLEKLETRLHASGATWADVDLLFLSNSKLIAGSTEDEIRARQHASDQAIISALTDFAKARSWFPSLVGSTVRASFFTMDGESDTDISDGLLWVAFVSAAARPVPVGVDISASAASRKFAGSNALKAALAAADEYYSRHPSHRPADADALPRSSLGLVLTSGSGHVEAKTEIDFKDCYAVGQYLKASADKLGIMLTGGCASNRSPAQSQTIYYSDTSAVTGVYHSTISHAAVVAVLPYTKALLHLEHPYRKLSEDPLNIDFDDHEMYAPGRYFCVRAINGSAPSDYLRSHGWAISDAELATMIEQHVPIPTEPRAHKVSIASAPPDVEASLWPNVPVWFERVGDEIVLRLVRAEAQDSDFFLVGMTVEDLVANAAELAEAVSQNSDAGSNLLAFLCESRKYVLHDAQSNAEAETLVGRSGRANVVGVYLNGEYSTGDFRSIGYHNYSQIGLLFTHDPAR